MKKIEALTLLLLLFASAFPWGEVKIVIHPALQGFKPLDPPGVDHPLITSNTHNANQLMTQLEVTNYSTKAAVECGAVQTANIKIVRPTLAVIN